MVSDKPKENIITFEQLMSKQFENKPEESNEEEDLNNEVENVKLLIPDIPRGLCKSGKFWKTPKTRAKTMIKTKGLQSSLEKRREIQNQIKMAKQLTRDALEQRKKQKEEMRQRRTANLKKQEENRKKAEIVQVVKNPSKIKKKHLRMIEKRDTLPFLNKTVY